MRKIHCIYSYRSLIRFLGINPCVFSYDAKSMLHRFGSQLFPGFQFFSDAKGEMAEQFSCRHEKPVFGEIRKIVHPSMFLIQNDQILMEKRQIKASSVEQILQKAAAVQSEWLSGSIKRFIDTRL